MVEERQRLFQALNLKDIFQLYKFYYQRWLNYEALVILQATIIYSYINWMVSLSYACTMHWGIKYKDSLVGKREWNWSYCHTAY